MEDLSAIFKALSDETRLRIVKLLEAGELCVCDITAALDTIQPKASFHLGVLRQAGLLIDRKQGKWTRYRLAEAEPFRRVLLASICAQADNAAHAEDRKRLARFLATKKDGPGCPAEQTGPAFTEGGITYEDLFPGSDG